MAFDSLGSPVFFEISADSLESRDRETWEALGIHSVMATCGSELLLPLSQVPGPWLLLCWQTRVHLTAAHMDSVPLGFLKDPIHTKPVCAASFSPDQGLDGDLL